VVRLGLLSLVLALVVVGKASPAAADLEAEYTLVQLINGERKARGLPSLAIYWDLVDDAQAHAGRMASAGAIFHNSGLAATTSGWYTLAENVGAGEAMVLVQDAFVDSPSHLANVLGDFNYVGVGVAASGSRMYIDVIFMKGPGGLVTGPFWDDETSVHQADIASAWESGVTNGCGYGRYCPSGLVTRGQMAAFLVRSLGLPATSKDHFHDDEGHLFEADINALAQAGITAGCSSARFCPDDPVTRAQIASFLRRGLGLPATSKDHFHDDEGHLFEADINALAQAGITAGCSSTRFCPDDPVRRDQMASFLVRSVVSP
jgi:hypothetical protein